MCGDVFGCCDCFGGGVVLCVVVKQACERRW